MNKRNIFIALIFILATVACTYGGFDNMPAIGSGIVVSETRSVSGFQSVLLEGVAKVDLTIGSSDLVVVEADNNLLPLINTTVQNGTLLIGNTSNAILPSKPIRIHIMMKSLEGIALSGSGDIFVSHLTAKNMRIDLSGSGDITVAGTADTLNIILSGSGDIHGNNLMARSVDATLQGSGDIVLYVSEDLDAKIIGSGDIYYYGNPAKVIQSITGSGNIRPKANSTNSN
jgi:hypothetical protein